MSVTSRSGELFARAVEALPGGVSSPVRAFGAVGGTPRFVREAQGAEIVDEDGNRYVDFVQSWGPLILGHAHPEIVAAVGAAARRGLTFGAPHAAEVDLAAKVASWYPGVERVRFTSSGTEATMSAIRLARGATGRDRLLKFAGCYHGHADGLLVAAGSGAVTFGQPSSAGVPTATAALTSVLPLDDIPALERYFAEHGAATAAVIVEPIPANNGLLLQRPEFLARLSELARASGTLVIFDEVISGFRVARGGAAELYGLTPDLVTFGKIIGGGLPAGAFAGPAATFEHLAPLGPVYQAGTLSGNPLAVAAGLRTLELLERDDPWARLEQLGSRLGDGVERELERRAWPACFVRTGSVFWIAFGCTEPPRSAGAIPGDAAELYARFFHACLERGVSLAPSAYEVGFLSLAHTEEHVDRAIETFTAGFEEAFER